MGWWNASPEGYSLQLEPTGLLWGDGPADIMDDALNRIGSQFREQFGRGPSAGELMAGLKFSLANENYDEDSD